MSSPSDVDGSLLNEIEKVLQQDISGRKTSYLFCEGFKSTRKDGVMCYYTGENRDARAQEFCKNLFEQLHDPAGHFLRLNMAFSTLLECNFNPSERLETVIKRVYHRLIRLPSRPPELIDTGSLLDAQYTNSGQSPSPSPRPVWEDLEVTSCHSTNTIRVALLIEVSGVSASSISISEFVNAVAESLEAASLLASKAEPGLNQRKWFIVRAFLWTTWQRSLMLMSSLILYHDLEFGQRGDIRRDLALRRTFPSPQLSIQQMSQQTSRLRKSSYMCNWAFELLRNDPIFVGTDFRLFHERFIDVFGNRPGRCLEGSSEPCDGKLPGHCQRFVGLAIQDQSAHDWGCPKTCTTMVWDEVSYRAVVGARAVSLDKTNPIGDKLEYCSASEKTLAISHVWSHGQGGRPETGLNSCLHRRYVSIARSRNCDSYWMDTPCIPDNHQLRDESIEKINQVFELSKITLVCDRDIMEIDIEHITVKLRESILAVLLVCDWNTRAWTFLEAFRGRHAIYLLCKNNQIVSLKETLKIVYYQGRLDIAMLFLTVPHLLTADKILKVDKPSSPEPNRQGFLMVETGGSLLSHRAASRPGDDIIIWSLLLDNNVFKTAEDFWRSRQDTSLPTSFLISSAPRLNIRGLGWAPSRPSPQVLNSTGPDNQSHYLAFDGADSEYGDIKPEGFSAFWAIHEFRHDKRKSFLHNPWKSKTPTTTKKTSPPTNIQRIHTQYLQNHRHAALLRPIIYNAWDTPAEYRGAITGVLVAVCGSNDHGESWEWRGVYEWDLAEPLPKFTRSESRILII